MYICQNSNNFTHLKAREIIYKTSDKMCMKLLSYFTHHHLITHSYFSITLSQSIITTVMHADLLSISGCTAYDVVINPTFYNKIQSSELFKSFFLTIVFEGLESKYDIELERNWTVLKNKKCMGVLQPHFIRSKSKPVIMEMDDENKSTMKEGKTTLVFFFLSPLLQLILTAAYISTPVNRPPSEKWMVVLKGA